MEIHGTKIEKLIVAGCSFSDYAEVSKNYSDFLSNSLELQNVHGYTSGAGSNQRIWRKILSGVRNKQIKSDTLVVIQYTDIIRKEFWTKNYKESFCTSKSPKSSKMREDYKDGGQIIKFKMGSHEWQDFPQEKHLMSLLENNFTSLRFDQENFKNAHFSLCNTLERYKIPTIFLGTGYIDNELIRTSRNKYLFNYNLPKSFPKGESLKYCLTPNDCAHLSHTGHQKVAERIEDFMYLNVADK